MLPIVSASGWIGGRYRVRDVIGTGAAASVHEADDTRLGGVVAIKILHPAHRKVEEVTVRLLREAYVGATLRHPHVCAVLDIGALDDGSPFVVMERLRGSTLGARIASFGPCAPSFIVPIALQLLSALAAAHERGVVRRDLKPENVFLQDVTGLPPIAKLLDFGAAFCPREILEQMPTRASADELTATGLVVGTPRFMAPEQAAGRRDIDGRTDIYQVGALVRTALTGRRPFEGQDIVSIVASIARGGERSIRDVMPALDGALASVIDRAMAAPREARFQSAADFQEALAIACEPARAAPYRDEVTPATVTAPHAPARRVR
jgi:eukaryotic-like serine/threonine-protein kinase